ncbi:GAF and ANTAR domain-containing protein [Brevibacterium renqingii]|uniref:GAF and ANTAR domain-containing protein n=1 Tax=Brevibacterium renqingii TaxID=2776916 RepID=UPI001AE02F0C|nr:GAF and ANTAR domain-containing protein [Brevibacterium renqingii]
MHRPHLCAETVASSPGVEGLSSSARRIASAGAQHHKPPGRLLTALVDKAVAFVEGAEFASLSVITKRRMIESVAPTGPLPLLMDWMQVRLGEGPSLDAVHEQRLVRVPDLSVEVRWPEFTRQARLAGVGSMLVIELFADDDVLGALSLYSSQTNAFTARSERVGLDIRTQAESDCSEERTKDQLKDALLSRDTIGQAKGILMERFKLTDEEAFLLLTKSSSLTNRKLRDIANDLTRTGALPGMKEAPLIPDERGPVRSRP